MKSAVCLLSHGRAVLSEHLGELDNPAAFRNFLAAVERLKQLLQAQPTRLAADLHPLYAATRWARAQGLPLTLVQHHHAHIAACMAEQGLEGAVVGLACDGTGYGSDGSIWGGEILVCDPVSFRRAAHFEPFALPGGDAAAKEPWRAALGLLQQAYPKDWLERLDGLRMLAGSAAVDLVARRLSQGSGTVACSSAGRLFDGVAALLGYCERNRYEAEAAMILQHEAETAGPAPALPWALRPPTTPGGAWRMDAAPMIRALLEGGEPGRLARSFHEGLAELLGTAALRVAEEAGLDRVVLSGGCFANGLLLAGVGERLTRAGLKVYSHQVVPCGDGGLALGQAYVAAQASAA
jgi:hydrogenase maturation protein HypF